MVPSGSRLSGECADVEIAGMRDVRRSIQGYSIIKERINLNALKLPEKFSRLHAAVMGWCFCSDRSAVTPLHVAVMRCCFCSNRSAVTPLHAAVMRYREHIDRPKCDGSATSRGRARMMGAKFLTYFSLAPEMRLHLTCKETAPVARLFQPKLQSYAVF